MSIIYLHVGPHKTGTTFLQKFMLDNADRLADSNLIYPSRFLRIFGHHDFRDALGDKAISPKDIDYLDRTDRDLLLSSEDFISLSDDHFGYLRDALPKKRFVVIYAWRRAGFKLYSIWQEVIKHGGTNSFCDYYHHHIGHPDHSLMLSPDLKLGMFSQVFNKSNVKVIDYDASARHGSLPRDFLAALERPWADSFVTPGNNPEAVNRAMDFRDIEVIRAMNKIFLQRHGVRGPRVRTEYTKRLALLQEAGLNQLKELVSAYKQDLSVGNYQIDIRAEQVMSSEFGDNMLNYEPNTEVKQITIAQSDWVLDLDAQKVLNRLAEVLRKAMKL